MYFFLVFVNELIDDLQSLMCAPPYFDPRHVYGTPLSGNKLKAIAEGLLR
jgi:hypothetical protein